MIRNLEINDYDKNINNLLKQLCSKNEIDKSNFIAYIKKLDLNENKFTYVIEKNNKIIAIGTLLIEEKLIHSFGKVGHIEDIIVDIEYREQKLGSEIINFLKNKAKEIGCYKIILNCNTKYRFFYEKNGFTNNGLEMSIYFNFKNL
jgi:glucosamine-phosphate N-acetyltransferase